jgi:hypothetical protein
MPAKAMAIVYFVKKWKVWIPWRGGPGQRYINIRAFDERCFGIM